MKLVFRNWKSINIICFVLTVSDRAHLRRTKRHLFNGRFCKCGVGVANLAGEIGRHTESMIGGIKRTFPLKSTQNIDKTNFERGYRFVRGIYILQ